MGIEQFKPSGKRIDDKELAHDMAVASDSERTAEAQLKGIVNPSNVRERLRSLFSTAMLNYTEDVENFNAYQKEAELSEDFVEINFKVKEATKNLAKRDIELLERDAFNAKKEKEQEISDVKNEIERLKTENRKDYIFMVTDMGKTYGGILGLERKVKKLEREAEQLDMIQEALIHVLNNIG